MDMKRFYDAIIIGGGPAGLTSAIYLARARYRVLVLEKDRFGGQIATTEEVVNYPGVAVSTGAALAQTMRDQAESFGAEFMLAEATGLDVSGDIKTVHTPHGDLHAFGVLLATGAHPSLAGFIGEERFRGHGVAYCATCDGEFFTGKQVFVVGGGYTAAEESVFLAKYASHVTILMRSDDFTCAAAAAEGALSHPKISIVRNVVVEEVAGDTAPTYLRYRDKVTGKVTEYRSAPDNSFGVFVMVGFSPATSLLEGISEVDERGFAVVDRRQRTQVAGLYAAGDVCKKSLRQVVTATGEGALAATELEHYAAAMQEKTGLIPQIPSDAHAGAARDGAVGSAHPAAHGAHGTADADSTASLRFLEPGFLPQLEAVFARMQRPLILELHLDDRPVSAELRGWMEELASLTDKLTVRIADQSDGDMAPYVGILFDDGTDTGLGFHGVPGGHEFTGFILGLYNAAGPGQPLDEESRNAIARIADPARIDIAVSLSCTNCPDTVLAAQRIASLNPHVSAHVYDIAHFPALKDRFNIMSVPCIINDGETVAFGRKNLSQMMELANG